MRGLGAWLPLAEGETLTRLHGPFLREATANEERRMLVLYGSNTTRQELFKWGADAFAGNRDY